MKLNPKKLADHLAPLRVPGHIDHVVLGGSFESVANGKNGDIVVRAPPLAGAESLAEPFGVDLKRLIGVLRYFARGPLAEAEDDPSHDKRMPTELVELQLVDNQLQITAPGVEALGIIRLETTLPEHSPSHVSADEGRTLFSWPDGRGVQLERSALQAAARGLSALADPEVSLDASPDRITLKPVTEKQAASEGVSTFRIPLVQRAGILPLELPTIRGMRFRSGLLPRAFRAIARTADPVSLAIAGRDSPLLVDAGEYRFVLRPIVNLRASE